MIIPKISLVLLMIGFIFAAGKLILTEHRITQGEPFKVIGLEYQCHSTEKEKK